MTATLRTAAEARPRPSDWVYVNNFKEPHKSNAIAIPAGRAASFQKAMQELLDDLLAGLPAVFQSDEYQMRHGTVDEEFEKQQGEAFASIQQRAAENDIMLLRTPMGFTFVPAADGKVISPEDFNKLSEKERRATRGKIEELQKELEFVIRQITRWEKTVVRRSTS